MKKLMFTALAVAGMSVFAETTNEYVAVEKLTLSLKAITTNESKVVSEKINGFVFTKADGAKEVYTWVKGVAEMPADVATNNTWKAAGGTDKKISVKKAYPLVDLGAYTEGDIVNSKEAKKQGKKIAFDKGYVGFGAGSYKAGTGFLIEKESISGNIVAGDLCKYGTWKVSYDKSTTKLMKDKKWTVKDVLGKNKVEFWDL